MNKKKLSQIDEEIERKKEILRETENERKIFYKFYQVKQRVKELKNLIT